MVKVYQYKRCSTCVKAVKFLEKKGVKFKSLDITETPPSKSELKTMLKNYEGNIKKLFNTSGVQYRELKIKDKLPKMTDEQCIDMLSSNGKLVKRPFLLSGKEGLVGFKEDEWKSLLK
tara:strand:+ start:528 stop:881 length:354 start_codon:yes stop_codon:yes gene_type:complete